MKKWISAFSLLAICLIPSACSNKGASSPLFTVGGEVSGLNGKLVLQNNGRDDVTVTSNGPFTFLQGMGPGSFYEVAVHTNPTGQTCIVSNGTGTILISSVANVSVSCRAGGSLDLTFNSPNGFSVQNSAAGGNGADSGNAVAVDAKGRIVVAGSSMNALGDTDMAVWRFNPDGTLDTTFNGKGFFVHDGAAGGTGGADSGNAVVVDSQNRILVAGSSTNISGDTDMAVWRLNPDGTLDTSFNGTGFLVHNNAALGNGDDSGNAIALDSQNRILVAGSSTNASGDLDMVIWRLNPNGTSDTGFNQDGVVVHNNAAGGAGNDSGSAIAVDSQNRIVVAGSSKNSLGNMDVALWRYTANGSLDTTFNTKGFVVYGNTAGGSGDDFGNAVAIDAQGRIVVAGSSKNIVGNADMVIWRFTSTGTLDTAFDADGIVINNGAAGSTTGDDFGTAVAIDSEGRILVAGRSTNMSGNTDMVLWRFLATGSIDITFADNGILINNNAAKGNGNDSGNALAFDSQNRILVAGSSANTNNSDMVVWRAWP